jgi:hypothetical protein
MAARNATASATGVDFSLGLTGVRFLPGAHLPAAFVEDALVVLKRHLPDRLWTQGAPFSSRPIM